MNNTATVFAQSVVLAMAQLSILSTESTSIFIATTVATTQDKLNDFASSLKSYLFISMFWLIATSVMMYSIYGMIGLLTSALANVLVILYIILRNVHILKLIATRNGLMVPDIL